MLKRSITAAASGEQVVRGLREVALLALATIALFLLISLVTFSLEDAGWSHTGTGQAVINSGGKVGAWISDFILSFFGVMAYFFPVMIAYHGVMVYLANREKGLLWIKSLRWIGFAVTVLSGATLAYIHLLRTGIPLPKTSGGILGKEVGEALLSSFGLAGATLLALAAFFAGTILFTGLSWVQLIDSIGRGTLAVLNFVFAKAGSSYDGFSDARRNRASNIERHLRLPKPSKKKRALKIEPVVRQVELGAKAEEEKQLPLFDVPEGSLPTLSLLDEYKNQMKGTSPAELEEISRQVEEILRDFGIQAEVVGALPGPVVTRFEIQPAAGVKVARISGLSKDLARALSVPSVRIVEIIPGKTVIGLEIPNEEREMVSLREVVSSTQYEKSTSPLTLVLGKDISGVPAVADLAKMPHLLVAGTTGSGKSVAINTMILSLLYKSTPQQVRMIMIDPKMLELSVYEGIPHLLTPVVTDMKDAANALRWGVAEMERRYRLMSMLGVRNLAGFNRKVSHAEQNGKPIKDPMFVPEQPLEEGEQFPVLTTLPTIVIIIDELADMMMIVGKKVEELIARLAQKARAAGLHLILATQRPSVDVLTGLIKANVPSRIAFQVSSKIDSRTIIDQGGAETLLGNGDMLYLPPGTSIPNRAHGAFVDDHEVHRVVDFLKRTGKAVYLEDITRDAGETGGIPGMETDSDAEMDPLYDEAVRIVTETRRASISGVQRRLKVGYNRAARMIEEMENAGVVGAAESNGSREVLAPPPPEE